MASNTVGRVDFLDEDDYFMASACLTAMQSRDTNTQVGACIVNKENKVIGLGYNTMPDGCQGQFSWDRGDENDPTKKYMYVCHAELNAIMNTNGADLKGSTVYVTLFPCNECAKLIIQAGISSVVYLSDKYSKRNGFRASREMLEKAKVHLKEFQPNETKTSNMIKRMEENDF